MQSIKQKSEKERYLEYSTANHLSKFLMALRMVLIIHVLKQILKV